MSENPFSMTDRVAIVTGGGTGIGEATARMFARFGAHTLIASRKRENLERVAEQIESEFGRRCLPVPTDVREEDQVEAMVEQGIREFGSIDVLVNNAGGTYLFPLEKTPVDKWDNAINLNLRGPFLCTREVGAHMIKRGRGAIVNISSGAGRTGVRGGAAYSAAKSGLQMFTSVVANEWGPHGIRANCIAVGLVASEGALRGWAHSGLKVDQLARQTPLRRVGQPDDVASVILFLASDAARFVTGETIGVDGGPRMEGIAQE